MSRAMKQSGNYWTAEYDAVLNRNPPVVVWRRKPNGVYVHVVINDPHTDGGRNSDKTACKEGHRFTAENTIITPDGRQCRTCKNKKRKPLTEEQKRRAAELRRERRRLNRLLREADEVAGRREQHRADNTPLMRAARTEL